MQNFHGSAMHVSVFSGSSFSRAGIQRVTNKARNGAFRSGSATGRRSDGCGGVHGEKWRTFGSIGCQGCDAVGAIPNAIVCVTGELLRRCGVGRSNTYPSKYSPWSAAQASTPTVGAGSP